VKKYQYKNNLNNLLNEQFQSENHNCSKKNPMFENNSFYLNKNIDKNYNLRIHNFTEIPNFNNDSNNLERRSQMSSLFEEVSNGVIPSRFYQEIRRI